MTKCFVYIFILSEFMGFIRNCPPPNNHFSFTPLQQTQPKIRDVFSRVPAPSSAMEEVSRTPSGDPARRQEAWPRSTSRTPPRDPARIHEASWSGSNTEVGV